MSDELVLFLKACFIRTYAQYFDLVNFQQPCQGKNNFLPLVDQIFVGLKLFSHEYVLYWLTKARPPVHGLMKN